MAQHRRPAAQGVRQAGAQLVVHGLAAAGGAAHVVVEDEQEIGGLLRVVEIDGVDGDGGHRGMKGWLVGFRLAGQRIVGIAGRAFVTADEIG